jgi:hypothetical protein
VEEEGVGGVGGVGGVDDVVQQENLAREASRGVHHLGWDGGVEPALDESGRCAGAHIFRSKGGTYEGEWQYVEELNEWKPHGRGTFRYASGNVYEGDWKGGRREGEGRYLMAVAGGDVYEGRWFRDKFHGEGKITQAATGKVAHGVWEHGEARDELWFGEEKKQASDKPTVKP